MLPPKPVVTVVCPAFREEAALPAFHRELMEVLRGLSDGYVFEVLYVDDGSDDGTLEVMRELARQTPGVGLLSLSRNFGKEAAMTAGLEHATGDAVITLDTDLQHPPRLIGELLERWRLGNDIVFTARREGERPGWYRRCVVGTFYRLMRWLSDTEGHSTSDYQLLSRRAVDALKRLTESHRYLRSLVSWLGFPSCVVPFDVAPRTAGRTKFDFFRLFRLASDGMLSFSRAPLRLVLLTGALLMAASFLDLGVVIALLFGRGAGREQRLHLLICIEVGLAGVMLSGLGIVGEYVGRIYEQVKQRPLYLMKEVIPARASERADRRAA